MISAIAFLTAIFASAIILMGAFVAGGHFLYQRISNEKKKAEKLAWRIDNELSYGGLGDVRAEARQAELAVVLGGLRKGVWVKRFTLQCWLLLPLWPIIGLGWIICDISRKISKWGKTAPIIVSGVLKY